MKCFLFPFLILMFGVSGLRAQTVTATNISGCDVWVKVYFGPAPCGSLPGSAPWAVSLWVPTGGTPVVHTIAPGLKHLYSEIYDCYNGTMLLGTFAPPSVGGGACGLFSAPSTITTLPYTMPTCTCTPGTTISATAGDQNATDWIMEFY